MLSDQSQQVSGFLLSLMKSSPSPPSLSEGILPLLGGAEGCHSLGSREQESASANASDPSGFGEIASGSGFVLTGAQTWYQLKNRYTQPARKAAFAQTIGLLEGDLEVNFPRTVKRWATHEPSFGEAESFRCVPHLRIGSHIHRDRRLSWFWSIFSHAPKRVTFYSQVVWATERQVLGSICRPLGAYTLATGEHLSHNQNLGR